MLRFTLMGLVCCLAFGSSNLVAQEDAKNAPTSVSLNADGQLVGKAFAKVAGKDQPVEAKVTLTKDGVVVKSIYAKEDGSFAFPSVEPGVYNMYGSAASYVGATTVAVQPQACGCSSVNLGMNSFSSGSYGAFSAAPASSYGIGGGGFGGGFGGGGFGGGLGGGGGLLQGLRSSRLLRIGALAGVVVAVASPD